MDRIVVDRNKVRLEARAVKGSLEGIMNAEKTRSAARGPKTNRSRLVLKRMSEAGKRESAADTGKRAPGAVPLVLDIPGPARR